MEFIVYSVFLILTKLGIIHNSGIGENVRGGVIFKFLNSGFSPL